MSGADLPPLIPAQQRALREIEALLVHEPVVALVGERGMGKSHVVRALSKARGGTILDLDDYHAVTRDAPNEKWQAALFNRLSTALAATNFLILDDFVHARSFYEREVDWWGSPRFDCFRRQAEQEGKKLVLCGRDRMFELRSRRDYDAGLVTKRESYDGVRISTVDLAGEGLQPDDYQAIIENYVGKLVEVDFETIHSFAPLLSTSQIKIMANLAKIKEIYNTEGFIDILRDYIFHSNIRRSEVENLTFALLPGTETIADALETHLVLPFENPGLARELGIRPRRGVMLFGPPGTGKTSIGRALAHRLGSRFFLLDGSFVTEPPFVFVDQVKALFQRVVDNAPSVLFIDDADVLFAVPHTAGLVRQLLSLLDGVESKNAGKVCVMITAMDPAAVPDALLRSGRIELWLEAKLPGESVRAEILSRWAGDVSFSAGQVKTLISLTEDFTPADLRRVAGDARLFRAHDRASEIPERSTADYLQRAACDILAMHQNMGRVLGEPDAHRGGFQ